MRHISCAILMAAVYGCGDQAQVTQPRQEVSQLTEAQYTIVKLPSLGGTQSRGMAINDQGVVAGWSNLSEMGPGARCCGQTIKRSPISGSSAGRAARCRGLG